MGGALRAILGGLLAVGLLVLLLRGSDPAEIARAIRGADLGWLAVAQLALWASFFTRVQRWSYVVRAVQPAPWRSLLSATQIGLLVNFTVPARLGEVVRALVLSRLAQIPVARSLAMVALDRVNDVIGLLAVLLLAALAVAHDATASFAPGSFGNREPVAISGALVRAAAIVLAAGVLAACLGLVLLYVGRERVVRRVRATLALASATLAARVGRLLEGFAEGLRVFRSGAGLARAILWSLASWGADLVATAAVLAALDVAFPWYAPFVMLSFVAVAILVPLTPGLVGQFHVPAVAGLLLAVPELAPARAKAVAIVDHLSTLVPIAGLGLFCLLRERLGLLDLLRRSASAAPADVAEARTSG
jgi:hypothetical protein